MKKILNFFTEEVDEHEEQQSELREETKTERDIRNYMFNQEKLEDTQELEDIFVPANMFEDTSSIELQPEPKKEIVKEQPKMIRNQSAYEDTLDVKREVPKQSNFSQSIKSYGLEPEPVKKVEEKPKVKEEPKKYKPRPFISPVHGIIDPEEKQKFYSTQKTEKRAVVEDVKYESKIETYERIRNKAFNTGPIELPIEEVNEDEIFDDIDLNVLEDVDFDAEPTKTDIDVEGKIFFDLVDEDLGEKKANYLFTTQEIIGDDIKVTTIEDIDRAYARDGVEFVNDENKAVNPFENTDEIDRENLLNLIDKIDNY